MADEEKNTGGQSGEPDLPRPIDPLLGIFRPKIQQRFIHFVAITATVSLCFGYVYTSLRTEIELVLMLAFYGGLAGFMLSSVVVYWTRSARLGALMLIITGVGLTFPPAYYEGGIRSPYALWFIVIPLVGGLMLGSRIAYVGGAFGLVATLALALFDHRLPTAAPDTQTIPMMALNMALAIIFCTALGAIVSRLIRRSSQELTEARNKEIQKNQALEQSSKLFRGSVNLSNDAIVIADSSSVIEMFNPAAEEMYRISSKEAIGRKLQELIIPSRFSYDHNNGLESFLETGEGLVMGVKIETHSMRNDGSEFPIELTVQRLPDEESIRFIGYIRDLTERNRLREELSRQEKQVNLNRRLEAVGRLSGGVAHDFNNLLMAINGHTDLLLIRDDLSEDVRSGLKEIAHAGDRAASITKQLLSFSRRDRLESRNIQLNKVISLLNEMIKNILPTSIEIIVDFSDDLWMVYTDEARLEQAILNLILNSADAQPEGGRIAIRTYNTTIDAESAAENKELEPGPYVCVEVSDSGTGMDTHTMERIFDPFFTTKTIGEGTGLGLSTAHAIVRRSGGTIIVRSEQGAGSVFKILLPQAEESDDYYTEPQVVVPPPETVTGTVLVVEDMDSVRRLVVRTLSQQGYRVLEAIDGERGYDLACRHADEIDLVVTDIIMPRLGGVGMVARLRVSMPDLKVVYVSGHSQDQLDVTDVSDPRTEFLYKPFSLEALLSVVQRLLRA